MKACCKEYLMGQFGDEEVVAEIYGEYITSLGQKLPECEAAIEAFEWLKLDRAAHAMKGNALAAGDTEVAECAIALRNAAKLQERDNAIDLVKNIKELSAQL